MFGREQGQLPASGSNGRRGRTTLFAVAKPFSLVTRWSFGLGTVVLNLPLMMLLAPVVVPVGCLAHHASKKRA
jgi:hypothetical protein